MGIDHWDIRICWICGFVDGWGGSMRRGLRPDERREEEGEEGERSWKEVIIFHPRIHSIKL